ncbi:protein NYNRIN-like [Ascaphus truei]|uniref:protein NYNRIN-like n=1 Tax=Ascaphus truei TaxID=8439 RepID=UPI003F5964A3
MKEYAEYREGANQHIHQLQNELRELQAQLQHKDDCIKRFRESTNVESEFKGFASKDFLASPLTPKGFPMPRKTSTPSPAPDIDTLTGGQNIMKAVKSITPYDNAKGPFQNMECFEGWRRRLNWSDQIACQALILWLPLHVANKVEQVGKPIEEASILGTVRKSEEFAIQVHASDTAISAVLLQQDPLGSVRILGYFSRVLSPVEKGMFECVKQLMAVHWAVNATEHIVGFNKICIQTPHTPLKMLLQNQVKGVSNQRYAHWLTKLQDKMIKVDHNAKYIQPQLMQYEGTLHDCHTQVQREKASPFAKEKDETAPAVFVDGARYWEDGQFWTGFAVNDPEGKKMFKFQLPPSYSAQRAELEAVKWVIENVEGKINIYSDSSYVVRALTEHLPLWCKRALVDASGKGLQHAAILEKLYQEGLDSPDRVAVLKVKAHQGISEDPIIMGNFEADIAAKDAARYGEILYPIVRIQDISSVSKGLPTVFIESVAFEGEQAKDPNIKHLRNTMSTDTSLSDQEGILCKQTNTGCLLPILPAHLEPLLVKYNHDTMGHIGTDLLTKVMQDKFWSATLVQTCKNVCAECFICAQTHPRPKGQKPQVQRVPIAGGPWENIQIDFIGPLPKAKGGYAYGLVVVDVFTKWPEVIPVRNCTALTTAKALWTHIFSHWGFPKVMECDNGPHFVGNITMALCGLLGI